MKRYKKYIIITIFLLPLIAIYNSDFFMFRIVDGLFNKTNGKINLYEPRNKLMKLIDDINLLKGKIWEKDNLPVIELQLNKKDLESIEKTIELSKKDTVIYMAMRSEYNNFRNAKMYIDKKKYKIKIKLHGTDSLHFNQQKKSYSIKLSKKNKQFYNNIRRFALIIPDQSSTVDIFAYNLGSKYHLNTPQNYFIFLKINGINQGIYKLEEKINKVALERNNKSGFDIFQTNGSWFHQYNDPQWTPFSYEYSATEVKNISKKDLDAKVIFHKLLYESNKIDNIKPFIDLKAFVKFEALRVLFGENFHMIDNKNFKLLYNTSIAKFYPIFRIEDYLHPLKLNQISINFEQYLSIGKLGQKNNLIFSLIKDNNFHTHRNRVLYQLLQQKDDIISLYNQIEAKYLPYLLNDTTNNVPTRFFRYQSHQAKQNLMHNFEVIKKYLEYARVFVDVVKKDKNSYEIKINPDSNSPIKTDRFLLFVDKKYIGDEIEVFDKQTNKKAKIKITSYDKQKAVIDLTDFLKDNEYLLSLDDNLEVKKNPSYYTLKFNKEIKGIDIHFFNDITKKEIKKVDTYSAIVDESKFDFSYISMSADKFISKHKDLNFTKINKHHLILNSRNYTIKEDVILPYNVTLTINKGTTIKIAPKKSLIVYANLNIKGTKDKPVVISNLVKGQPFGVVGAIGNGDKTCKIEHLTLYGGKDAVINGAYLSGGLSLYNHKKVIVKNSFIHHNSADDGMNIKNAEIEIIGNTFNANKADQVDLDFCNGFAIKNRFIKQSLIKDFDDVSIPIDDNGDGLDFSGSKMIVYKNYYNGFLDKGISIGEHTKALIINNTFVNNRSAVTAKDQSKVYLYKNIYQNNKINLEMYQKKKFFKHPSVCNIDDDLEKKIKKTKKSHYYKTKEKISINKNDLNLDIFKKLKNIKWIEYE